MKKTVLVVMPESPFPPRKNGIALRYYPLLQRLCDEFDIDLAISVYNEPSATDVGGLKGILRRVIPLQRNEESPSFRHRLYAQLHRILPFGVPFDHYYYGTSALVRQLRHVLAEPYDAVIWVTQNHVLYECLPYLKAHRLILDGIDSMSLHTERASFDCDFIRRLRVAKANRWEAKMINSADIAFFISPVDLAEAKSFAPKASLELSPNGVLVEDYTAEKAVLQSPSIGFLGNMSYMPNIDAAHRLVALHRVLKEKIPNLSLYIVGRDPAPALLDYANESNVFLTGTVDSIWPYVNAIDVFVMPMAMGAGQQNKLLEVMYAGRPIVASSIANGGVLAIDGESVLIADNEVLLQEKTLSLLLDPEQRERLAVNGQKFVRDKYGWDRLTAQFASAIYGKEGIRKQL